jgi:hypothetical protein
MEDGTAPILQPHLMYNLKTTLAEEAIAMKGDGTPGTPWFKIFCPKNEDKFRLQVNLDTGPAMKRFISY